ncbi:porin family protein [Alsobacter sp. SYSU M60028]|uniref:Porin family protein n=1 Tax=Alsobacter ponti TaxID=2962936 RepID=A0ABT1LG93_9HYPH|nr:outer membrane protein [Alsobacter ponti]MCP8940091.1 porin family protein [Alsobacter ponti]
MNKTFLTAAGVLSAAFTPAIAADLPVRTAPAAPVMTLAPYNWTGFYAGVNAGFVSADTSGTGYNPGGPTGACWSFDCSFSTSDSTTGVLLGGQLGYNFQSGAFVFGVEGDLGWTNANSSGVTQTYTYAKTGLDALGTLRLRLGYAFDRVLVYGTGGLAFGNLSNKYTDTYWFGPSGSYSPAKNDGWQVGWTLGAGVEYAINNNWTVKAEGLYYAFDKTSGVATSSSGIDTYTGGMRSDTNGWVGRIGLNYRFGGL